jgi:outer membrane lipoprotein-sorting protein
MKRSIILSTFFLFATIPLTVSAQQALFNAPVTPATRKGVESVCAGLSVSKIMRGDFIQRKDIKSLSRSFSGNGTFTISRDDGIIWNTVKPFPSLMVVGAARIVQSTPNGKTSVIDASQNPVFTQFADTIRAVFSGNSQLLFSRFDVYYLADANGEWQIGLVPNDSVIRSVISSMVLSGGDHLSRFRMSEPSGDTVQYDFSNMTFSGELNDAEKEQFSR